jgi:hypothetical protein
VLAVTSWTWALSEMLGKKVALLFSFAINDSLIILKLKDLMKCKVCPQLKWENSQESRECI